MRIPRNAAAVAAVAGALWALPGAAMAAPSILGPNGYLYTPDGFTTPGGCASVAYHFAEGDRQRIERSGLPPRFVTRNPDVNTFAVDLGVGNRLELGMARVNTGERRLLLPQNRAIGGDAWIMNAKLAFLPPSSPFQMVAGVIDATGTLQRTPYVYASTNIGRYLPNSALVPRRVELGAGWGTGIIEGAFVNAGVPITPNMELMFEWVDNNLIGTEGPGRDVNVGGRFRFSKVPGLAVDLAAIDFSTPSFGLSYTYCRRHRKNSSAPAPGEEKGTPFPPAVTPGKGTPPPPPPGKSGRAGDRLRRLEGNRQATGDAEAFGLAGAGVFHSPR